MNLMSMGLAAQQLQVDANNYQLPEGECPAGRVNYLGSLAATVCAIDFDKTHGGCVAVPHLVRESFMVIDQMKMDLLDIGELSNLFTFMQNSYNKPAMLVELVGQAHAEIERLLGNDAGKVYCEEDKEVV